ncbi:MAG TPA: hypothetical protein VEZ90_01160 [Blastocatellia bacterium]|nr:hypothetical protein [Blastocatellia bacterium]
MLERYTKIERELARIDKFFEDGNSAGTGSRYCECPDAGVIFQLPEGLAQQPVPQPHKCGACSGLKKVIAFDFIDAGIGGGSPTG